ncbi:hypothetical protein IT412_01500 [Candidatus Peregrinibacteria bacterium]|nr:hypothetical protein [Candidatus Peregrinibacteria bacterium]
MFFRKLLAIFLIFLFVVVAVPNFFVYALSKTYLSTDFYKRDDFTQGVYDFAVVKTAKILQESNQDMKGYFTENELVDQIKKGFSIAIFRATVNDFAKQIEDYKNDQSKPLKISLRTLRENLLSVSNNLSYLIYQSLPTCSEEMTLREMMAQKVLECVPKGIDYDDVVKPLNDSFETTIYNQVPEELSNLEGVAPVQMLVKVDQFRDVLFLVLVGMMVFIVLLVYGKTSTVLGYLGSAFLLSGVIGYGLSFGLDKALLSADFKVDDLQVKEFFLFISKFFTAEFSRLAMLFALVGFALLVIRFVLKRTVEDAKPMVSNI